MQLVPHDAVLVFDAHAPEQRCNPAVHELAQTLIEHAVDPPPGATHALPHEPRFFM